MKHDVLDEKKLLIENDDIWKHPIKSMGDVIVLIHRHDTFRGALEAFSNENIRLIKDLHNRVIYPSAGQEKKETETDFQAKLTPANRDRLSHSYKTIMDR